MRQMIRGSMWLSLRDPVSGIYNPDRNEDLQKPIPTTDCDGLRRILETNEKSENLQTFNDLSS